MFAYRRKKSLGCEQLEGRFAPSSVLVGGGGRSTFKDAQAVETAQAEQAASYLAASAVMSQSSSVANVAPIICDQPAVDDALIIKMSLPWTSYGDGTPPFQGAVWQEQIMFCMTTTGCKAVTYMGWSHPPLQLPDNWEAPQPTADGTASDEQPTDDTGVSANIPSLDPSGTDNGSSSSNDAAPVAVEPVNQQPVGVDDPTAVDPQPVSDSSPVTGDSVTHPTSVDDGPPIPDASGAGAVDAVPVESKSDDSAGEVAHQLSVGSDCIAMDHAEQIEIVDIESRLAE
jgi:hypothetical protein